MKKLLALIMAVLMVLSLCACGADKTDTKTNDNIEQNSSSELEDTSSEEETTPKFEVTVTDADGNAVQGVMVQLCKDTCVPAVTDANGVATFNAEITDGYKLSVMSCPEGYESENTGDNYIYLEEGETSYTLEITKK